MAWGPMSDEEGVVEEVTAAAVELVSNSSAGQGRRHDGGASSICSGVYERMRLGWRSSGFRRRTCGVGR